jgi:hypothetical protein
MKPRTELLWKFHDTYLKGATGPVTIEPPGSAPVTEGEFDHEAN